MQVTVDGNLITLAPGMTVRHALLARYGNIPATIKVTDRWGNRLGLDGALSEGTILHTVINEADQHR